jgi:hypothetical protein
MEFNLLLLQIRYDFGEENINEINNNLHLFPSENQKRKINIVYNNRIVDNLNKLYMEYVFSDYVKYLDRIKLLKNKILQMNIDIDPTYKVYIDYSEWLKIPLQNKTHLIMILDYLRDNNIRPIFRNPYPQPQPQPQPQPFRKIKEPSISIESRKPNKIHKVKENMIIRFFKNWFQSNKKIHPLPSVFAF